MKPHYKISAEKLDEGTDITAECGVVVPKAVWAFMLDRDALILDAVTIVPTMRDCRKCVAALFEAKDGPRYIYALLPGEERLNSVLSES